MKNWQHGVLVVSKIAHSAGDFQVERFSSHKTGVMMV